MARAPKRRCALDPRPRRKCATEAVRFLLTIYCFLCFTSNSFDLRVDNIYGRQARETYVQDGVAAATAEARAVKVHGNDTGLLPSE